MSAVGDWLRAALLRDMAKPAPRLTTRNALICLDCEALVAASAQACPACASRSLILAFPRSQP